MIFTREHIKTLIDPRFNGLRVKVGEDYFVKAFSSAELDDVYYRLTASRNDDYLIMESPSFDDVDQFYNPGDEFVSDSFILEAITVVRYAQTDKRMAAFVRVMSRFLKGNEEGIEAQAAIIGRPKKSGSFAYVTVQIPFSDGQSISMVFHSPDGDKKKIGPEDALIAFRWLINKRDITHVVAPENGQDVSLMSVGKRITQLLVKNHARFVKTQKAVADETKRLEQLTSEMSTLEETNTEKAAKLTDIEGNTEVVDTKITNAESRINRQQIRNADIEAEISVARAKKMAKSVGGDEGEGTSKKSKFAQKAIELKKEYESRPPLNNKEYGVFKRRVRALAKKVPSDDNLAVMAIDFLATKLDMDDLAFADPAQDAGADNKAPIQKDIFTYPEDVEAIQKAGGYQAILADPKLRDEFQDILDSAMNQRILDVRNALKGLGWDGEPYKELSKNGTIAKLGTIMSSGNANVVGYGLNGVQDDLTLSADVFAAKVDATVGDGADSKTSKKDPFWNPAKLPGEIRVALKKVKVRPVIGEISTKAPRNVRKGGHLIMNAPRPLMGDPENMWNGDFNHGRFYSAIDPNGEFAKSNIEENRKLDAWLLGHVTESDILEYFKRGKLVDRLDTLEQDDLNHIFMTKFDKLTYPEFLEKWNKLYGEKEQNPSDNMTTIETLPEGWEAVRTTLGYTYSNGVAGIEVTPREDGSFNIEKVSKGGEVRENQAQANDERNANRIALEMMSQVDGGIDDPYPIGYSWTDEDGYLHEVFGTADDGRYLVGDTRDREDYREYLTAEDIANAEKRATANIEFRKKQDAKAVARQEKEDAIKAEYEDVKGFAKERTSMQKANLLKALNKNVQLDGKLVTRKEFIEDLVDAGNTISTREENKVKPMSKRADFRANQQEQDEHERKIREAGKKTVYSLGSYDITKTEYDYAEYLIGKMKASDVGSVDDPKVAKPEQRFLDTLNSIIAGDYNEDPARFDKFLDEVADELESMGLIEQYDDRLNEAADIAAKLAVQAAKEAV